MSKLTGFRRDILIGVARSDEKHGLGIRDWMEDNLDYEKVHHGRLYPNLETLENMGLVVKEKASGRSNSYSLTPRGEREIQYRYGLWEKAIQ